MESKYHVIRIIEKQGMVNFGKKVYLSSEPMNHEDAVRFLKSQTYYAWARNQLEEVWNDYFL